MTLTKVNQPKCTSKFSLFLLLTAFPHVTYFHRFPVQYIITVVEFLRLCSPVNWILVLTFFFLLASLLLNSDI